MQRTVMHPSFGWGTGLVAYYGIGAAFALTVFLVAGPLAGTFGIDAYAYWSASPPLYDAQPGALGAYLYSPAFYQATEPLRTLEWPAFAVAWVALNLATAVWLGPLALAFPATSLELYHGNIHLLLAAAIVLGFRYPAVWSFVLLTKATAGIGLLWFAARREWRSLIIALAATAGIALISLALAPDLWVEYVDAMLGSVGTPTLYSIGVPLWLRLPAAAFIVVWGAWTDRRWTVAVAATLALPVLWWHGLAVLASASAIASRKRP